MLVSLLRVGQYKGMTGRDLENFARRHGLEPRAKPNTAGHRADMAWMISDALRQLGVNRRGIGEAVVNELLSSTGTGKQVKFVEKELAKNRAVAKAVVAEQSPHNEVAKGRILDVYRAYDSSELIERITQPNVYDTMADGNSRGLLITEMHNALWDTVELKPQTTAIESIFSRPASKLDQRTLELEYQEKAVIKLSQLAHSRQIPQGFVLQELRKVSFAPRHPTPPLHQVIASIKGRLSESLRQNPETDSVIAAALAADITHLAHDIKGTRG